MNRLLVALSVAFAIAPVHAQPGKPIAGLQTIKLSIGQQTLTAEVAANESQRSTGLMNRFSLPPDHGMLFVFAEVRPLSFWMRNTYVALSIAFIDAQGRIVNIEDMAPHDERSTYSAEPALYALEVRKGWFAQKGITAGMQVHGLPTKARE